MKNLTSCFLFLLILVLFSCKQKEEIYLKFSNDSDLTRTNEIVYIPYNDLINLAGDIETGNLPVFILENDTLVSQNTDQNNDGIPEEILVEISLDPRSSKDVRLVLVPAGDFPVFTPKTNLHFARKESTSTEIDTVSRVQTTDTQVTQKVFQLEGPVWENDKVGFRNYFDLRNGMDIFGKSVTGMVLDTIGLGGNYHVLNPWGMDVLKVGNSLGAGSIGLEINGKLYRIGDNGRGRFERVYEGPLKSEFRFDFHDWQADGKIIKLTQYISITAGQYAFASDVYSDKNNPPLILVAGIVNKMSNALYHEQVSPGHMLIATHDKQSENNAYLGMGILVPAAQYIEYAEAPETGDGITETYYAKIKLDPDIPSKYYFYAGWETSNPEFGEMASFISMVKKDAMKFENPVKISRSYPVKSEK